jgi:hypothetical protein
MYINLRRMFERADAIDYGEGCLAYTRYHLKMKEIARAYDKPLEHVVAAFVALSPQNDYLGNLRSLITLLESKRPLEATVSTFGHCKQRAVAYLDGSVNFERTVKGPKIRSFYKNILDPLDQAAVTVDGHIKAIWIDRDVGVSEAIVKSKREYEAIASDVRRLAFYYTLIPCQAQAILWFTRKRVHGRLFDPQLDWLFQGNQWRSDYPLKEIKPYA